MSRMLTDDLTEHREEIYLLLRGMSNLGKPFLLRSEIL